MINTTFRSSAVLSYLTALSQPQVSPCKLQVVKWSENALGRESSSEAKPAPVWWSIHEVQE